MSLKFDIIVGLVVLVSGFISRKLTFGRVQGSAIAILIGLALAWVGGKMSGGSKGLADLALFSGIGLMGGNMLRDFAIVATAFEVHPEEAKRAGWIGADEAALAGISDQVSALVARFPAYPR